MWSLLLGLVVLALAVLFALSGQERKECGAVLSAQDYPLRQSFLPMGSYFLKKIKYSYQTPYDFRLYNQLAKLYGYTEARQHLQIFWANKIGYLLLTILISTFFLALMAEPDWAFLLFALLVLIAVFLAPDREIKQKIAKRELLISLDFPEFLNKLTLLLNAGLTVRGAWEKIVLHQPQDSAFYQEVGQTWQEIKQGKSETEALEDFARRCRVPEITRFTTIILQNLKKGNAALVPVLRLQANECWEMRKNAAKRLGEEASTKLLLPMMLMFIALLLIVATPAILALKGL